MRIPIILLSLLAIFLLLLFWSLTADRNSASQNPAADTQSDVAAGSNAASGSVEVQLVAPRAISPETFAQPFAQNAIRLERIAPRKPLTPPKPKLQKRTLLYGPVVAASGLVSHTKGQLQLAGIEVLDPIETCTDEGGDNWPCGIIARTAFRNFLRGRALSCTVPDGTWTKTVVSQCFVGKQDPAAWLVDHGWAHASAQSDYIEREQAAKQAKKGVYGSDPRKTKGSQY